MKGGKIFMIKYETPEAVIIRFEAEDIIVTSGYDQGTEEI